MVFLVEGGASSIWHGPKPDLSNTPSRPGAKLSDYEAGPVVPRVMDRSAAPLFKWLTSPQQRLFKSGGRLMRHARYFILQLAESYLTSTLFRTNPLAY